MRLRLVFLLFVVVLPVGASAQTPVRLDVRVTGNGVPLSGLTASEITVLEDGKVQSITSVEEVRPPAAGRARVYVVFIDSDDVPAVPLARFLDRLTTSDDLIALATPETPAATLTLGTKNDVIAAVVQGTARPVNQKERLYRECYADARPTNGVAEEMISRRRETMTLDAFEALIARLDGLREERKAVVTVTQGWRLFRENRQLARAATSGGETPRPDPFGRRRRPPRTPTTGVDMTECEADRAALATINNSTRLRAIAERANRATVSFYPVTPQALTGAPVAMQPSEQESLRDLANETDGQAMLVATDLEAALSRIPSDLSSYYLLSYSSSNGLIDGGFREVTVRVDRPGVRVRARRGYRAPTAWELTNVDSAITRAFSDVSAVSALSRFRLRTSVWTRATADGVRGLLWAVGELDPMMRREVGWTAGAVGDVLFVNAAGEHVMMLPVNVDADTGTFSAALEAPPLLPGEYAVRAVVRAVQDGVVPVTDVARVEVPSAAMGLSEAVLWHRGPVTGPRFAMTADPRFARNERVRFELASAEDSPATARLLDRQGNPLPVPITLTERSDESGEFRWIVAELTLAPLAVGSYAVEVTLAGASRVTAFSVVP